MSKKMLALVIVMSVAALIALLAVARGGFWWPYRVDVDLPGPYVLRASEHKEQLHIGLDTGKILVTRVDAVVVDVGWDGQYIVASQRPPDEPGGELSYYYIAVGEGTRGRPEDVTGPLTEDEFNGAKQDLGLPEFTLHYSELR